MKQPTIVIIRGSPASGKSTLSIALRDKAISQGVTVSLLSWDFFHHLIEPRHGLTRKIILQDTRRLLKSAQDCLVVGSELIIIDGVFVYPEENAAIDYNFSTFNKGLFRYRLVASESNLLKRNLERNVYDQLPSERVCEVANDPCWQLPVKESVLDSNIYKIDELSTIIWNDINHPSLEPLIISNLTSTQSWRLGSYLRFPDSQKFKNFDLLNSVEKECWQSNTFFDFNIIFNEESKLLNLLKQQPILFPYLNLNSNAYTSLKNFSERYGLKLEEQDRWPSPLLRIPQDQSVRDFLVARSNNLKRSLKKSNGKLRIKCSSEFSPSTLWQDAIKIDRNSWKANCHSDMWSLNREDIQYLPGILSGQDNYNLVVGYHLDGTPASWSLMIFDGIGEWYSVKWGCTDRARKLCLGIECLVSHIEILYSYSNLPLHVDFWARRSKIYDSLAVAWRDRINLKVSL